MTKIKICGVTTLEDALDAARAGADMLGLNFYAPSPRYVTPDQAAHIAAGLRRELGGTRVTLVGVFVNEPADHIHRVADVVSLDLVQLSGDQSAADVAALAVPAIKAIRPRTRDEAVELAEVYLPHAPDDDNLPTLLLDAYHPDLYGGTGQQAGVEVALAVREITPRLMLAGGLKPENVRERVKAIRPWGVDVASGVEGKVKGRKDQDRMRAFVKAVRAP